MKHLRLILAGVFALMSMGFFSSAFSEMQQINDNYLSYINGQTAIHSVSDSGSKNVMNFLNNMERVYGVNISDEVKESDAIAETFDFIMELSEALDGSGNPFMPRFSLFNESDPKGVDIQMGGLKLHLKSIDINGTVSIHRN